MKKWFTIAIVFVKCGFLLGNQSVVTNGLSVSINTLPLFYDEICTEICVCVSNCLTMPIYVPKTDNDVPDIGYVHISPLSERLIPEQELNREIFSWTCLTNICQFVSLPAGQTKTLRLETGIFDSSMCHKYSVTGMSIRVEMAPNVFFSSSVFPMQVIGLRIRDTQQQFQFGYDNGSNVTNRFSVCTVTHNGERHMFSMIGKRITSLDNNEVPSFAMNTNAAILTVTLPVSRKTVRYYPRTGRIEEESMP